MSEHPHSQLQQKLIGFVLGGLAGCGAVTFTNPFEVVKTRLQLQGELQKTGNNPYPNAFTAFYRIFRNEGLRGVQKGLFPAYIYQVLLNGTRLGLYEPLRDGIQQLSSNKMKPVVAMVSSGAISGIIGAFVASPLFLVKTRMQSYSGSSNLSVGFQHEYVQKGTIHALRTIYKANGIRGLWRGADASMIRTGVGSAVQLSTYDATKQFLGNSGWFSNISDVYLHFSASLMTSLFVVLAMTPLDVVSTRMYNQQAVGSLYSNAIDCILKTVKTEGITALYKGLIPHYLRIGPHTILTFVLLEQLKAQYALLYKSEVQ